MNQIKAAELRLFSLQRPFLSVWFAFLTAIFFTLTVLGTYGTYDGGTELVDDSYLSIAYLGTIGLFFMLLLFRCLVTGRISFSAFKTREGSLLIAFVLLAFIPLLEAPHKTAGTVALSTATLLTVMTIASYVRTVKHYYLFVKLFFLFIFLTSLAAVLSGVYTYLVGPIFLGPLVIEYNAFLWRVDSWFINSTAFGVFQVYGFISVLYGWNRISSLPMKFLLVASGILFVCGVFMSGARSAIVLLVLAVLVIGGIGRSSITKYFGRVALGLILTFIAGWFVQSYGEELFVLRRFVSSADTSTLGGRLEFWNEALSEYGKLTPFQMALGTGIGTFRDEMRWEVSAHSGYLRILIEHGIFGLIIFASLTIALLTRALVFAWNDSPLAPELRTQLALFVVFFAAEFVLQQLMGVSMGYLIFLALLGLHLSYTTLRHVPISPQSSTYK